MPYLLFASVIAAVLFLFGERALAVSAGDLKGMKIVGHYFTTRIANDKRALQTPSHLRLLVLKLAVVSSADDSKTFLDDFVLQYSHTGGKEDRARSAAICQATTPKPSEEAGCVTGEGAWILLDKTSSYLSLAFPIEGDVGEISLGRVGAQPVPYTIGPDRQYSVHIATNQEPDLAQRFADVISSGGYQVMDVADLKGDVSGVVIYYAESAETQAREISQRIMTELKVTPAIKKMGLISNVDIVVWIGVINQTPEGARAQRGRR